MAARKKKGPGRGGMRVGAGRKPLPVREQRANRVVAWLTDDELAQLNALAMRDDRTVGAMAGVLVRRALAQRRKR